MLMMLVLVRNVVAVVVVLFKRHLTSSDRWYQVELAATASATAPSPVHLTCTCA